MQQSNSGSLPVWYAGHFKVSDCMHIKLPEQSASLSQSPVVFNKSQRSSRSLYSNIFLDRNNYSYNQIRITSSLTTLSNTAVPGFVNGIWSSTLSLITLIWPNKTSMEKKSLKTCSKFVEIYNLLIGHDYRIQLPQTAGPSQTDHILVWQLVSSI